MTAQSDDGYDGRMDPECIPLCDALNRIPGIETFESCCGHGRHEFWIWMFAKSVKSLFILSRVLDKRYYGFERFGWFCQIHCSDNPDVAVTFWLRSRDLGQPAYDQANQMAKAIDEALGHKASTKMFKVFEE